MNETPEPGKTYKYGNLNYIVVFIDRFRGKILVVDAESQRCNLAFSLKSFTDKALER